MTQAAPTFPGYVPPAALRPELERRRDFALDGPKAERQRRRIQEGRAMASQILGSLHVELVRSGDTVQMVDTLTGELIEGGAGERLPERFAALLYLASNEENHFVGHVCEDEAGPWEMGGAAFTPSLRICPNFMEVTRRRSRVRARAAIRRAEDALTRSERIMRRMGWKGRHEWAMLTLTMPPVPDATVVQDVERFNKAFALLRKREDWRLKVRGAVKAIEAKPDAFHPHVHGHVLILSRYWEHKAIKAAWAECIQTATLDVYGVDLAQGGDPLPVVVDVRAVKRYVKPGAPAMTMDDAVEEVVKYVTKPDDLAQLHPSMLLDLCLVERWPRMFELLGACRAPRKARKVAPEAKPEPAPFCAAAGGAGSLDTACTSDGATPGPIQPGLFDGAETDAAGPSGPVPVQEIPSDPPPKLWRPPTWRQLMHQMDLSTWLEKMFTRAKACRRFRARQLFERFNGLVLWTLTGRAMQHA